MVTGGIIPSPFATVHNLIKEMRILSYSLVLGTAKGRRPYKTCTPGGGNLVLECYYHRWKGESSALE